MKDQQVKKLQLFKDNIGKKFKLITGLEDEIIGVNEEYMMVEDKKYGDFHVNICELIE